MSGRVCGLLMVLLSRLSLRPGKCGLSARFSFDGFAVLDLVIRSFHLFMELLTLERDMWRGVAKCTCWDNLFLFL